MDDKRSRFESMIWLYSSLGKDAYERSVEELNMGNIGQAKNEQIGASACYNTAISHRLALIEILHFSEPQQA